MTPSASARPTTKREEAMKRILAATLGVMATVAMAAMPAQAQKAKETLRLVSTDWWGSLDPYFVPLDEAAFFYRNVYESLLRYDERNHKFVPMLATSWKRIDPKTLEFELRQGVKFSNGDNFDADDVVWTINFLKDPKIRIRFKDRYNWVDKVEKLGPYKIRIVSKEAFATDLQTIAYRFEIYDSKVAKTMENMAEYGRDHPVTTGPYTVVSLDRQKMVLKKNENYWGGKDNPHFRAPVKNVVVQHIPDRQTQVAQYLSGGIDVIRNVPADTARQLAQIPGTQIVPTHAGMLMYVTLDAAGRSSKLMTDQRVRKAFMMAVNRPLLVKTVVPGGAFAEVLKAACIPADVGCSSTTEPPAYNPAAAKKLLAEAGYPDGVDMDFYVHQPVKEVGEAIAGQVRAAGFRSKVHPLPLSLYVRMRGAGKFTAFNGFYPTGAQPDVDNLMDFFFDGNRDYWKDPEIKKLQAAGHVEFDEEKRNAIYQKAMDIINEKNYILPVADLPIVFAANKDVKINPNPMSPIDTQVGDLSFK
jgi:peptide/nickel transport system substrate-binding protein